MSQLSDEQKHKQEIFEQFKNKEISIQDLQKELEQKNIVYPSSSFQKVNTGPPIFLILVSFLVFVFIIFLNIKQGKKKASPASLELSNKEQQVAEILEKKNLEKIVSEGLETTIIKVRCRSCDKLNDEGDKFCSDCGKKV